MKFHASIISCLILASCSSNYYVNKPENNPPKMREPSSEVKEETLAKSFEIMMNSQDPQTEFESYLNRMKNIFIKAESYLGDFDKELDELNAQGAQVNFDNSKPYKKLLIMREMSSRMQDKITYFYIKLTDISYDKSKSSSERKMAKTILKSFKKQLDSTNAIEKLSFDDLKNHIAMGLRSRRGYGNKSLESSDTPVSSFKDDAEKLQLIRSNRDIIRRLAKSERFKDDELNQKVDIESEKIQLVDQQNGREPQSEKKFFPSVGPNGNIMGLIFPKGVWALTYDDGPSPVHTPKIVANLDELGIHATFFWLAQNVIQFQSTVDLVRDHGNARADHSWSHPQLPKLSDTELDKEITKSSEVEAKAYGEPVKFFRCPYGAGNSVTRIRQRISDLGMIHVFWNVDTLDWQDKDPDSIVERAKKQMQANGHGVILFHDIHPQSVIASKKLVEWSKTYKGTPEEMRWVTIPEIVKEMNGE